MKVKFNFRKIYQRVEEGEYPHAIIAFGRRPYERMACDHGNQGHEVTTKYECRLLVDLWLFTPRFDWIGKGDTCPNLSQVDG